MSMGVHRKENLILTKIFFHLYINGGAQERKINFIRNIFKSLINGSTTCMKTCIINFTFT